MNSRPYSKLLPLTSGIKRNIESSMLFSRLLVLSPTKSARMNKNIKFFEIFYATCAGCGSSEMVGKSVLMPEAFRCRVLTVCVGSPMVFPVFPEIVVSVLVLEFELQHFTDAASERAREIRGDRGCDSLISCYTLTTQKF